MARPLKALDLCCCAGGAGYGYHLAGLQVTGVDIQPQPNYPFAFTQADALEYLADHGAEYDLIHISPPCQRFSPLNAYNHKEYPDLITPSRPLLEALGLPYVIENVEAAASELINPVLLCGPMFGLQVYRHRLFETGGGLVLPQPEHDRDTMHTELCTRNGYLPTPERPFMSIHGGRHSRAWQNAACDALGMPWIKVPSGGDIALGIREVCEAIPPAYTEYIGGHALAQIRGQVAA